MQRVQYWFTRGGLWCLMAVALAGYCTGCAYDTALQRLSLPEQSEFHVYRHLMTPGQAQAYLSKATAAERTAYLHELGLAQRFQALGPLDRDAVLSGMPRQGMEAEALRFMWGEPYYTMGSPRHDEHWYYLGSSLGLAATGNQYGRIGNQVDVYLVHGQVVAWVDFVPSTDEDAGDTFRR